MASSTVTQGYGMLVPSAVDGVKLELMPIEPLSAPAPGEVLLRVDVAGLCHSDLHILDSVSGRPKFTNQPFKPFALCHEIGGTVLAVGQGVSSVTVGKQYVLYPWLGCGKCFQCEKPGAVEIFCEGREQWPPKQGRIFGLSVNGGFASHLMIPDAKYLVDPGSCPLALACTYTCGGLTTFSAVKKAMISMTGKKQLTPEDSLLVIGAGGLGLHAISWAKILVDAKIVVAENDTSKHIAAKEMGADLVLDTSDPATAVQLIKDATGGGPQAVIDLVGAPATSRMGRQALRKGGTQVQVGLFSGDLTLDIGLFATEHKHLLGNFVGTYDEFVELMGYVRTGKKKEIPYETRPLTKVNEAIKDLREGKIVGRCVLTHDCYHQEKAKL